MAMVVAAFPQYAFGVLGPFLVADLGLSRAELGALTTAMFVAAAGLSPVSGRIVDRIGGRRSMLMLFAATAAGLVLAAVARTYLMLLAATLVTGVGFALGNPATNHVLAFHVDPHRKGALTGVKQSGVQAGAFLAGIALPGLADGVGWRGALLASLVLPVVGLVLAFVLVPPTAAASAARGAVVPRGVWWLAVYAAMMGAGVSAIGAYLPLYAVEAVGTSAAVGGALAALMGGAGVLARLGWGRWGDRTSRSLATPLLWLAVGAVLATVVLIGADAGGVWLLPVAAVGLGSTAVAWNAIGMLAIVRDVAPGISGAASGRVLLGFYVGLLSSPVAFGFVVDRTGSYTVAWVGVGVLFAVGAVVAWRWRSSAARPAA